MKAGTKAINFGEIDHFLYVRINCVGADLGYNFKEFIENSYYPLVDLIDEKGVTHFSVLREEYKKYADYREKTRYAPRMTKEKHKLVVSDIHEEVHKRLEIIKKENDFLWINILQILLMVMELEMDKEDHESWKRGEIKETITEEFSDERPSAEDESYRVHTKKKEREYYRKRGIFPESFKKLE
jgi:hypothetical protein